MNNFLKRIVSVAALLATSLAVLALEPTPQIAFSVGATNNGTSVAWCTISANSENGGVPVVTDLNAGSNTNNVISGTTNVGAVIAWRIVDSTMANFTNTTTSVPVVATNTFTAGDLILVRHKADDNYERLALTTATSGTNLTLSAASAESIIPGDIIYRLSSTNAACIAANNTTNNVTGNRVICGQKGLPLHLSIQGLNSAAIFNASGYYESVRPSTPLTP